MWSVFKYVVESPESKDQNITETTKEIVEDIRSENILKNIQNEIEKNAENYIISLHYIEFPIVIFYGSKFKDTVEGLENKRQELRKEMGKETVKKIRPNQQLYEAIKDRYQELLKELWKSQSKLEEFGFNIDEKKILNDRVKLWLEYFISTAAFRDDDINLFEYMDTFCETQKFI